MRMSHFVALADILLGAPKTLARSHHDIVNGTHGDFETAEARRRCAIAVNPVGMAVDRTSSRAACAGIADEAAQPLASPVGEGQ